MRRKRSVIPTRFRSATVVLVFVLGGIVAVAVLAAEWRASVVGVELDVRGISIVPEDFIRSAAGVSDSSVLASMDLLAIRDTILENPYIRDVRVTRNPPRTLRVDVRERTPIAVLINVQSDDWLLDEDGYVLPTARSASVHDLPVITGIDDRIGTLRPGVRIVERRVMKGLQALKSVRAIDDKQMHLFSEISLEHDRDIVFYTMEGGVPVIFGTATKLTAKMRAFSVFWENVAMKYDPTSLEYIDLRWKDQVVTRWRRTDNAPRAETSVGIDTLLVSTRTADSVRTEPSDAEVITGNVN
ncbi:MAG: cell division protein FtsQ/DivIB [Bacteroidetes bacterium]|nr:cell division protein FtsQ/DivIB [Bacteroidota bacterium]